MHIRDRIKDLRRVPASQLKPNPKNWRTHPAAQHDALRGILAEVGYADALLARETPEGDLLLIDGHLRAETTPDAVVPVLVLDVDEAEAAKILATLDPLAAMAQTDAARLDELLQAVETGSPALQKMLAELAARSEASSPVEPGPDPVDESDAAPPPQLASKYAIVVQCESEQQQLQLLADFESQGLECRALVV
jgi:hypothetical protein